MTKLFTLILSLLALVSCTYKPQLHPDSSVPTIIYENGWNDQYSSAQNIFVRHACVDHNLFITAQLPDNILHQAGEIAQSSDFFELPNQLPLEDSTIIDKESGERLIIVSPCFDYKLSIYYKGKYNSVHWTCNHNKLPDSINMLVQLLNKELYSLKSIDSLPESQCRYR